MAYFALYPTRAARWGTPGRAAESALNVALIAFGGYTLVAGTYVRAIRLFLRQEHTDGVGRQTSVQSIIVDSRGGKVFSCASNGF